MVHTETLRTLRKVNHTTNYGVANAAPRKAITTLPALTCHSRRDVNALLRAIFNIRTRRESLISEGLRKNY